MRRFTVYTYYWPQEDGRAALVLAYTRYHRPSPQLKTYEVEAENGTKAKQIAVKLRRAEENARQEQEGE